MLIGLCGPMGSGKDYIGEKLLEYFEKSSKTIKIAFADQLKINVMTKHNTEYDELYIKKNKKSRMLLQKEGVENGRNVYGDDIWIKYLDNWVKVLRGKGYKIFIVTDVRMKNEMDYIRRNGGILIKIKAHNRNLDRLREETNGDENLINILKNHTSEIELTKESDEYFDIIFQNDYSDSHLFSKQFDEIIKNVKQLK